MTCVSEVIMTFLQVILFANTAAFFCSLLGLVSHSFWEANSGEEISTEWALHQKDQSLTWWPTNVMTYRKWWPTNNRLFMPIALY